MEGALMNAVSSVTGAVSKAVLMIQKTKTEPEMPGADNSPAGSSSGSLLGIASAGLGAGGLSKLSSAASALNSAASAIGTMGVSSQIYSYDWMDYFKLQVQFNPSTISITNQNGNILNPAVTDANSGIITQQNIKMRTTFRCDLIFDDMNIADAFSSSDDMFTAAGIENIATNIASNVTADSINSALGTSFEGHSVRKYVEGLLGALMHTDEKNCAFVWGNMVFRGELTEVRPEYTMFNKKGEPIRAKVSIAIFQSSAQNDYDYWKKAYKNMGFK